VHLPQDNAHSSLRTTVLISIQKKRNLLPWQNTKLQNVYVSVYAHIHTYTNVHKYNFLDRNFYGFNVSFISQFSVTIRKYLRE
jgi:hypothetical protein